MHSFSIHAESVICNAIYVNTHVNSSNHASSCNPWAFCWTAWAVLAEVQDGKPALCIALWPMSSNTCSPLHSTPLQTMALVCFGSALDFAVVFDICIVLHLNSPLVQCVCVLKGFWGSQPLAITSGSASCSLAFTMNSHHNAAMCSVLKIFLPCPINV